MQLTSRLSNTLVGFFLLPTMMDGPLVFHNEFNKAITSQVIEQQQEVEHADAIFSLRDDDEG